jgi:hypothetical protein
VYDGRCARGGSGLVGTARRVAASQCTEILVPALVVGCACATDKAEFLWGCWGGPGELALVPGKLLAHFLEQGGAHYLVAWRCIIHHAGEARSKRRGVLDGCVFLHRNPHEKPF